MARRGHVNDVYNAENGELTHKAKSEEPNACSNVLCTKGGHVSDAESMLKGRGGLTE